MNKNSSVKATIAKWQNKGKKEMYNPMKTLLYAGIGLVAAVAIPKTQATFLGGAGVLAAGSLMKNKHIPILGLTMMASSLGEAMGNKATAQVPMNGLEEVKGRFIGLKDAFVKNTFLDKVIGPKTEQEEMGALPDHVPIDLSDLDAIEAEMTASAASNQSDDGITDAELVEDILLSQI